MADSSHPPPKLLTLSSGGWVLLLSIFFTLVAAALVLYPVYTTGGHRAIGDGQHLDSYQFPLDNLAIPRDQLIPSGKPKDAVRAVPEKLVETITPPEVDLIVKNEHIRFLVPSDSIIGITINGQSRAYPTRILNLHEIVNDTLAGTPIAVTWSPLTGSAAIFDRRISPAEPPSEFGVSGLLYNANLVLFNRNPDLSKESLFPQLSFKAISGPRLNQPLTILPFQLTTWQAWHQAHPETTDAAGKTHSSTDIFLGLRTLKLKYNNAQDPFTMYNSNDAITFPTSPLHPFKLPNKTPITLSSYDNAKTWTASLSNTSSPTTAPSTQNLEVRLYAYLFAWYAQHPNDTDYAALNK